MKNNEGRLPIEDDVDVISVGTSFLRFLEIAAKINKPVAVVTDNDGDYANKIVKKYQPYENTKSVKVCADSHNDLNTLEPQITEANKSNLKRLRFILGIEDNKYDTCEKISEYMEDNKTESALKIFDATEAIIYPDYILDAINWEYEQE